MVRWTAYLLVVSGLMSLAGFSLERAIRPYRFATRWIWVCALLASLPLPILLSSTTSRLLPAAASVQSVLREASETAALTARRDWASQMPVRLVGPGIIELNAVIEGVWVGSSVIAIAVLFGGWLYGYRCRRRWRRAVVEKTEVFVAEGAGPATVGVLHPQIVVPEWLLDAPAETLRCVLAHERSHVEARDPAVWSLGLGVVILAPWNPLLWLQVRRLRLAIEVDCDRRVLSLGHDARRYARTLVDVSTQRPAYLNGLAASPRSGSSIERRIMLMNAPRVHGWRATTTACALLSVGVATTTILISPPAIPRTPAAAAGSDSAEATDLSRYVGDYEFSPVSVFQIRLRNGQLTASGVSLTRVSGQVFRYENIDASVRFATDATGRVIGLVLKQNGVATTAPRIGAERVRAIDAVIREHVRAQAPTPGSEAALRQLLAGIESGKPDYAELSPQLAGGTRAILPDLQATMKPWGPLRAVEFRGVGSDGWDQYLVRFERGAAWWRIALDPYGLLVGASETEPSKDSKP